MNKTFIRLSSLIHILNAGRLLSNHAVFVIIAHECKSFFPPTLGRTNSTQM